MICPQLFHGSGDLERERERERIFKMNNAVKYFSFAAALTFVLVFLMMCPSSNTQ